MRGISVEHWSEAPDPVRAPFLRLGRHLLDLFIVVWLFNASGALFPLLVQGANSTLTDEGSALLRLLLLPNLAMAPLLVALRARAITRLLIAQPMLVVILLWVTASITWSLDPEISGRRVLAFVANSLITLYVVTAYRPEQVVRRLVGVLLAELVLSLAFAVTVPDLAFMMQLDGAFRGIFTHKNSLGECMTIAIFGLFLAWRFKLMPRALLIFGFLLVAAFIVPVDSATSLVLILVLALLHLMPMMLNLPRGAAAAAILLTAALSGLVLLGGILMIDEVMAALGRDLTLTGRTDLWAFVISAIRERPLLGYGYVVFFELPSVVQYTKEVLKWDIPHAHNGYLQVWLDLGLPGLVMTIIFLVGGMVRAVRRLGARNDLPAWFGVFWLTLYLGRNISESDFLLQSSITWPLAIYAVLIQGYIPPGETPSPEPD